MDNTMTLSLADTGPGFSVPSEPNTPELPTSMLCLSFDGTPIFHISSSRAKIRLHVKNQLLRLPGSSLKVPEKIPWWVVGSYPLSRQAPTHVEVELGCDNK
jgi:hypothetical protein